MSEFLNRIYEVEKEFRNRLPDLLVEASKIHPKPYLLLSNTHQQTKNRKVVYDTYLIEDGYFSTVMVKWKGKKVISKDTTIQREDPYDEIQYRLSLDEIMEIAKRLKELGL